jgi:O-methyltransferase involved in polyketide biosynthesis
VARAALDGACSTLLISLMARAVGDAWFPDAAVGDRSARRVAAALGEDPLLSGWVDAATAYGVLVRTRVMRELARSFIARQPGFQGVHLACGLADYFQWLDNGQARWLDVDLPAVVSLRRRLMPPGCRRQRLAAADLTRPGWWSRLRIGSDAPALVLCEGLLMYLAPADVQVVLREIATPAARGSEILVDAWSSLAVGTPWWCAPVYRSGVPFRWGVSRPGELAAMHGRLTLLGVRDLLDECGWPFALAANAFRSTAGVPCYAIYRLGVGEACESIAGTANAGA